MNTEMDTLFHQYLDGRLSTEETATLVRTLTENPAAAERFAELTRVDEALRVELKAESRSELFTWRLRGTEKAGAGGSASAAARTGLRERDRKRWIAAAAGLAVLGSGAWWFSDSGRQEALVNAWAKITPRVKVKTDPGLQTQSQIAAVVAKTSAAELRRKLKGFALPMLHVRAVNINDALATLNRQWGELPHRDPGSAEKVIIALTPEAQALWKDRSKEPGVTLDMPGLSLYTALDLVAAQAGLRVNVGEDSVLLEPDPKDGDTEKKTWTFPVAKGTSDRFLAAISAPAAAAKLPVTLATTFMTVDKRAVDWGAAVTSDVLNVLPSLSTTVGAAEVSTGQGGANPGVTLLAESFEDRTPPSLSAERGETIQTLDGAERLVVRDMDTRMGREQTATLALDGQATAEMAVETPDGAAPPGDLISIQDQAAESPVLLSLRLADANGGAADPSLGVADVSVLKEYTYDFTAPTTEPDPSLITNEGLTATANFQTTVQPWYFIPPNPNGNSSNSSAPALNWITVTKPQQPTVAGWMGAFGVDAAAVSHDTETGVVSVTGDHRVLRTAAAALAAMNESAQAGVNVEMRVVDLGGLPEPSFLAGKNGPVTADAAEVEELCRKASSTPGAACLILPGDTPGLIGERATYSVGPSSVTASWGERETQIQDYGASPGFSGLFLEAAATKSGESWTVEFSLTDDRGSASTKLGSVTEGEWTAKPADFPGRLLLFRVRSASVTQ